MESIGAECNELKKKYDECFNEWFSEYLKGKTADTCHAIFQDYKKCVDKALAQKGIDVNDAYTKVLGTPQEMSLPESKKSSPTATGNSTATEEKK